GKNSFINSLLLAEDITSDVDIWGSMETNAGALAGVSADVLPVYTDLTLGATVNICVNAGYDAYYDDAGVRLSSDGNKLADYRYLRLDLSADTAITFEMTANPTPEDGAGDTLDSDPDIQILKDGALIARGWSGTANSEVLVPGADDGTGYVFAPSTYSAGTYALEINDWMHESDSIPAEYPERVCFDFTAN
ncbi:MAG: hypothetical protein CMO98_11320, partial [Woeseia sp.]|nr:hypothetical protein [Woeseia sp.]